MLRGGGQSDRCVRGQPGRCVRGYGHGGAKFMAEQSGAVGLVSPGPAFLPSATLYCLRTPRYCVRRSPQWDKALCVSAESRNYPPPPSPACYPHTRGHCVVAAPAVTTIVMAALHTAASHDLLSPHLLVRQTWPRFVYIVRPLIVSEAHNTHTAGAAEGTLRRHVRRESGACVWGKGRRGGCTVCTRLPRSTLLTIHWPRPHMAAGAGQLPSVTQQPSWPYRNQQHVLIGAGPQRRGSPPHCPPSCDIRGFPPSGPNTCYTRRDPLCLGH